MNVKPKAKDFIFNWEGAMALVVGMIGGILLLSVVNSFSIFVFNRNLQYEDFYFILANSVGFIGAIFAFDYLIVRRQTGNRLNFNLSRSTLATYFMIFPMMVGMMLIAEFVTSQIPITGPFFGRFYEFFSRLMEQMTNDKATLIISAVVLAPVLEEIIFRGIIQRGLINKGMNPWKAIVLSSVIFGLVHGNPWQFVGASLLGCVLGIVYYKTKNLLLPILLHAFNNLCSALLIFYSDTESFAETFQINEYLLLGVGIILFGVFYYLFIKKYRVHFVENV